MQVRPSPGREDQATLPEHFHDIFAITSATDFKHEDHTRKALQAEKGRGMLQFIFGSEMTELEMVDAFHGNIKTLLSWQNSAISSHLGAIFRFILVLTVVSCAVGTCLVPIYFPPIDYTGIWSSLVAIICCAVILEPSKCLVVSWFMFLRKVRPAFYYNPIYLKSNPSLIEKSVICHPHLYEGFQPSEKRSGQLKGSKATAELYGRYYKNRRSTRLFDRRRRILPIVVDIDIPVDLQAINSCISAIEVQSCNTSGTKSSPSDLQSRSSDDGDLSSTDAGSFNRAADKEGSLVEVKVEALDCPVSSLTVPATDTGRFKGTANEGDGLVEVKMEALDCPVSSLTVPVPTAVSSTTSKKPSADIEIESASCDLNRESVSDEVTKHTPYIYCRYSNFPK